MIIVLNNSSVFSFLMKSPLLINSSNLANLNPSISPWGTIGYLIWGTERFKLDGDEELGPKASFISSQNLYSLELLCINLGSPIDSAHLAVFQNS